MNIKNNLLCIYLLCLITSCGVNKYLPEGETLYRGAHLNIIKEKGVKQSKRSIRKKLSSTMYPVSNKFIFGQPYKVWWWFVIGVPKHKKGFKVFLREKLGEPPVFGDRIKPISTSENLQAYLENEGYFHSTVKGDTLRNKYLIKAVYQVNVKPQYKIRNIVWVSDSSMIMKSLVEEQAKESLLKTNDGYSLTAILNERSRLDLKIKTRGYFYFNPNYLMSYVDSSIGENNVDLYLNIKSETPDSAKHAYSINSIIINPNYNLFNRTTNISSDSSEVFDQLIIKKNDKFTNHLFARVITYRPNSTYNIEEQNKTLNRFINLGNFKFVKNSFISTNDSSENKFLLNSIYFLSPTKKKSFQGQIDGFSKENKFIGSLLSLNWKNRNTSKGSELLTVKTYGGFEISYSDSLKKNNNFRIGSEISLTFPRFIIPLLKFKESSFFTPHTRILVGYELFRKQGFYTKNVFRTQYEFNWKETINKEHSLAPIAISFINATNISQEYLAEALTNPAINTNIYSEVILGSFYSFTTNTKNPNYRDLWYFNGSIDLSGNIVGLAKNAQQTREKKVFNSPFAQYVKADIDLRYLKKITPGLHWANRIQIGASIPYHNSNMLPFSKQYIIGGSNSIRGFRIRQLGPGSHLPSIEDQTYYFIIGGDYKFLLNTEIRLPIIGALSTAIFTDVGNIWTKDTLLFGKAGQIKKDMYKELAVAGGIGIRYDFKILLLRFDFAIPFRKPYLQEKERWVIRQIDFGDREWRRQNLTLNFAIGFPF